MKKKILTISLVVIISIILAILIKSLIFNKEKKSNTENNNEVVSILTIDVNPSIQINLDKNNIVINVIPLNDDSKLLLADKKFYGKTIENTLETIISLLKEKNYFDEGTNAILINVKSNDKELSDTVQEKVETITKDKEINVEVIMLSVEENEELKDLAEKNNITISKAYYIEEIIKEQDELTFEELKDLSINEISKKMNNQKEVEIEKETEKEKVEKSNTETEIKKNQSNNTSSKSYGCNPPADLKSKDWCVFNKSRPQTCEYFYSQKINNTNNLMEQTLSRLGIDPFSALERYATETVYEGSSYCLAIVIKVTDRNYAYTLLYDSVTGELLKESSTKTPTLIDENIIKQKGLEHFGINEEDARMVWVSTGVDKSGGPDEYYRHQVNIDMPDGTCYSADYNAVTGVLVSERTWKNSLS